MTERIMSDIVRPDSYLTLHYRLALAGGSASRVESGEGTVVDTFGDNPATLQMGSGHLTPALEEKLLCLATGDRESFMLEAAEAFGDHKPGLVLKISRPAFDSGREADAGNCDYRAGDVVEFNAPNGSRYTGV